MAFPGVISPYLLGRTSCTTSKDPGPTLYLPSPKTNIFGAWNGETCLRPYPLPSFNPFGLVGWTPTIPFWKGLLLRGTPRIPNHRAPNHKFTISWWVARLYPNLKKNNSWTNSNITHKYTKSSFKCNNEKLGFFVCSPWWNGDEILGSHF